MPVVIQTVVPTDLQCWAIESLFLPEFTDWKPSDALYSHTSVLEQSKWAITGEYCTASQSDSKEKSNIVNIDIDNPVGVQEDKFRTVIATMLGEMDKKELIRI